MRKPNFKWAKRALLAISVLFIAFIALVFVIDDQRSRSESKLNSPENVTASNFRSIEQTLEAYRSNCSTYPSTNQGIKALCEKPMDLSCPRYPEGGFVNCALLGKVSVDGWEQPIRYAFDGHKYRLEASHDIIKEGP